MARSSTVDEIIHSHQEYPQEVRVAGVSPESAAWICHRVAAALQKPLAVICPDSESSNALAKSLRQFKEIQPERGMEVLEFPSWEHSPYSPIHPSIRVRHERISTLVQLTHKAHSIVVSPAQAAFQTTLPKDHLNENILLFRINQNISSREELLQKLRIAGYGRVDPVEDPGTFALRGEILDIYPPDQEHPFRMEFFDTTIERIRSFSTSDQRTIQDFEEVAIGPARELLLTPENVQKLRSNIKTFADERGIHRKFRDPVLTSLSEGVYHEWSDHWLGFLGEPSFRNTLLSHLSTETIVIWFDELTCTQKLETSMEKESSLFEESISENRIVPDPNRFYVRPSEASKTSNVQSTLYLDRLDLSEDLSNDMSEKSLDHSPHTPTNLLKKHRIDVRNNLEMGTALNPFSFIQERMPKWREEKYQINVLAPTESQLERLRFLFREKDIGEHGIQFIVGRLPAGFRWPAEKQIFLLEHEILGTQARIDRSSRPSRSKESQKSHAKDWSGLRDLSDLNPGDYVVHVDHGIGKYVDLVRLQLDGAPSDFIQIEYAGSDKLYLPVYRMGAIQKYLGGGGETVLNRLGGNHFEKTKAKVKETIKKLAVDLVEIAAQRKIQRGPVLSPQEADYREFEATFPFEETQDQLRAIEQTLGDLESGKVTDRLICGDVGFGKTEVALRASFLCVLNGMQTVVLVPTTLLAHQHEETFRSRLKNYPIRVESLSRLKTTKERRQILTDASEGKIDILIGTHALLNRELRLPKLGLLVIDEEHRFGVEHKEKLKALRLNTHVLTLTATPIPRTLQMALSGLREISLIATPPIDRLPVKTYIAKFDEPLIKRAIDFEIDRGGQVFFVHNRVQTIYEVASKIRKLLPSAKVAIAHGQMSENELEKAMLQFYRKEANILICTSIIESGLDIPNANTLIVDRADRFGLAQLYQIRGRVGRSNRRAYAYLLVSKDAKMTEDAKKRLEVIQKFVELGSGFNIASHDLEIRGGGNLLGPQQSGQIAAVGFDLYTDLLDEAIHEIQGRPKEEKESAREPEIKAPFPAYLPEDYVPDVHQRLSLYRRLSTTPKNDGLNDIEEEMRDRYGKLPEAAQNLLWLIRIKWHLKRLGVDVLTVGSEKISLFSDPRSPASDGPQMDPKKVIQLATSDPKTFQILPNSKLIVRYRTTSLSDLFFYLEKVTSDLVL